MRAGNLGSLAFEMRSASAHSTQLCPGVLVKVGEAIDHTTQEICLGDQDPDLAVDTRKAIIATEAPPPDASSTTRQSDKPAVRKHRKKSHAK
jgi:hypothetical protein